MRHPPFWSTHVVDGGGSGEDTINSHDGDHDTVRCGPDEDTLNADGKDEYGPNCENVI
jgi:hypothetical protein